MLFSESMGMRRAELTAVARGISRKMTHKDIGSSVSTFLHSLRQRKRSAHSPKWNIAIYVMPQWLNRGSEFVISLSAII